MECDNCGENGLAILLECTECPSCPKLCPSCDTARHKNPKNVNHNRTRKTDCINEEKINEQVKAFQSLVFGEPKQYIENVEFVKCPDKIFSFDSFNSAYQKRIHEQSDNSLLKLLVAEVRDACRFKSEFDKVLYKATNLGGPIALANVNDFIICLQDACKHHWQQQNIVECLTNFDYPITVGHNYCSMKIQSMKCSHPPLGQMYGLHLGELYHLINCGKVETDHSKEDIITMLSLGTIGTQNKSRFLNEIWNTKFEEWSLNKGLYHKGLLELQIGTDVNKRKQHILDLHGTLNNEPCLKNLCHATDIVILHCQALDFNLTNDTVSTSLSVILNFIDESKSCQKTILIFHGFSTNSWSSVEQQLLQMIKSRWKIEISYLQLNSQWQEKQTLHQIHEYIYSQLKGIKPQKRPLKYLYHSLCESRRQSENVIQNELPTELECLRSDIAHLLQRQEHTRLSWFPLNKNSMALAFLEEQQYESVTNHDNIKVEQLNVKKKRNEVISAPVKFFRDRIINKDDLDEAALTFTIFQQELSRRFQPSVEACRIQLKSLKEAMSKKPTEELKIKIKKTTDKLIGYDIACIHFIRELIERGKDKIDMVAESSAVTASQNELLMGRSIEVINGDSLTIPTEFLQNVLEPIFQTLSNVKDCFLTADSSMQDVSPKKGIIAKIVQKLGYTPSNKMLSNEQTADFVSITVIGVESSGKSTLWNELWNTNFPVAHGKCSRGLWSAFVQVNSGPSLLVNDTEGILSPLCLKPRFDQKLVLLAFALSHIVVINIQGEGDRVLIDLLKLIIYAAHTLSLLHRPQIVFVHRDVMGVKSHEQGTYKNILLDQLHDACDAIGKEEGQPLKLEEVIDVERIHSFDLPSAINEIRKDVAGCTIVKEEKTAEFVIRCRELRCKLIEISREMVKDSTRQFSRGLGGEGGWVNYAQRIWELARQNASLWAFASVHDMLQRRYIETKLGKVVQHWINDVNRQGMEYINTMMTKNSQNYSNDSVAFTAFLSNLQKQCESEMEKSLNQIIGEYSGPTAPVDVVAEYRERIKRDIAKAIEQQQQLLFQREQNRRFEEEVNSKVGVLKKKIDSLRGKNYARNVIEEMFEGYVKNVLKDMETVHMSTSAADRQMQAVSVYIRRGFSLRKQFAPEFIRRYLGDQEMIQIANELNKAFWENVSTQLNAQMLNESAEKEIHLPRWAIQEMSNFKVKLSTKILFYKLEAEVFKFLWVNNMKKAEMNEKSFEQDMIMASDLCGMVHAMFVSKMLEEKKGTIKTAQYSRKQNPAYAGYETTITNLFHAFACSMLYYFIQFHHMHVMDNRKQKFCVYCNTRKNEIILRADRAKNANDAANKTVKLIFDSLKTYTLKGALEALRQGMQSWSVDPGLLVKEAMETTFHGGDFDGAYEFIITPVNFIKRLYIKRFHSQFDIIKKVIFKEYLEKTYAKSNFNKNLDMIVLATTRWFNNKRHSTVIEAMHDLFAEFNENQQSFLNEIENSIISFLENTQNETKVDFEDFLVEMYQQLTDKVTFDGQEKINFVVPESVTNEILEELWPKSRGCEETCPYCGQKCSGNEIAHTSHNCDHHLLLAFNGWRDKKSCNASLRLCTEPKSFTSFTYHVPEKYQTGNDAKDFVPFTEHINRFHSDWSIVQAEQNEDIGETEKVAWLVLRDRLAENFKYKTETPPEWETLYRERATRMMHRENKAQEKLSDFSQ